MFRKPKGFAITAVVLMSSTLMIPVPAQQGEDLAIESPDPTAGFFAYSGGPVRAKRARTRTNAPQSIPETVGVWRNLSGATLSYTVASGAAHLFNVAFSAECRLFNSGSNGNDAVIIRIADTVGGVTRFLEPNDAGGVIFCSADSYALHKGNWVRNAGAGTHVLQVQFRIVDALPNNLLTARIDDWALELVVYD